MYGQGVEPIELTVKIEPTLPHVVEGAVSFETGATRQEIEDAETPVYEHHGEEFSTADTGALPRFFEDLISGRAVPLVFATPSIQDVDTLVAIAAFLHRDLAVHPAMPGFVYTVDFVHRGGLPALAHVDEDFARFVSFLRSDFPEKGLSKRELGERLKRAVNWIRDWIFNGNLPHLGVAPAKTRLIDRGTNGFVVAQTTGSLFDGWVDLYRQGFLRGLLINTGSEDRRHVLIARKSHYVNFDLVVAAHILNEMESAMGELPEWETDGLWLKSPEEGTLILVRDMLEVLTRV